MQRMSALDAGFISMEDGIAHMHIAGLCLFEGACPTSDELEALLASKLHLIPRYRQRVRSVPLELGRPVWVDDPHFRLGFHVRHTALPAPGDDAQLDRLMGRLMSQPLDRNRPLWEAWLVDGIEGDRWGIVFKVHHCMVDGIAGVGLLTAVLDLSDEVHPGEPLPWTPSKQPSGAALTVDAWRGLAADVVGSARQLPALASDPLRAVRSAKELGRGLGGFVGNLTAPRRLSVEGSIGPHRAWAHSSVDLDDVSAIRSRYGGTVNDVVLAAIASGFRDLLSSRGEDPDRAVVRTLVPVSVRGSDGRGVPDNRVSVLLCRLPVHLDDPLERLRAVHDEMAESKGSHMAETGEAVTRLGDLAPPMVVDAVLRLGTRAEHVVPQRIVHTITTNVPGPQFPLYCLGHEMLEYRPFVPITHGIRIGTAVLSYNGRLSFGVTGDLDGAPDVAVVADGAAAAIAALAGSARAASTERRVRRRSAVRLDRQVVAGHEAEQAGGRAP